MGEINNVEKQKQTRSVENAYESEEAIARWRTNKSTPSSTQITDRRPDQTHARDKTNAKDKDNCNDEIQCWSSNG